LGQPGDPITPAQFTGEEAPPPSYFDGLITALCHRWSEDGKPKAIVRVPPMRGGRSGELVRRLTLAFESQGARVLDATGTGVADLAELSIDHSRHALLTCCFLADHEVGQEWIVLREVRRGIEAALGRPTENPAAADAENAADEPLAPEVRAEVELVMAAAREQ